MTVETDLNEEVQNLQMIVSSLEVAGASLVADLEERLLNSGETTILDEVLVKKLDDGKVQFEFPEDTPNELTWAFMRFCNVKNEIVQTENGESSGKENQ